MTSSTLQPPFCPALYFSYFFITGFFGALACFDNPSQQRATEYLHAPGHIKKTLLYFFLAFCLVVAAKVVIPCSGCNDYFSWFFSNPNIRGKDATLSDWLEFAAFMTLNFSGFWVGIFWRYYENLVAGRAVHRFMRDCVADSSMRFVYETTCERGPSVHDLITGKHDLWHLANRAITAETDSPVYIVMNISAEQALQKLHYFKLITKNGYKRLPAPKNRHLIPRGGCVLQFYSNAEYVRIWG